MRCCLHSAELEQLEADCLSYQRTVVAACGQPLDLSHFSQSVKEEEQQALLEAVQVAYQASLQRLKCEYCNTFMERQI
jgi:nitrate reductase assembly molybdenum cofactor insertion protein NarJ